MTRILWSLSLGVLLLPTVCVADSPRPPNIVIAFADDWGRYASILAEIEGAGTPNDLLKTPNIDKIARSGVVFRQAYVNAPSCTPCRSAFLSGQYFFRTRQAAILQGAIWDEAIPSFPLLLEQQGYHIGQTYKVWSPGAPVDAPYGGQRTAYEKAGGRFNQFSQYVTKQVAAGKDREAAKQDLYQEVTQNFKDFLAAQPADKPFCYWFGPTNVHRKWVKGSGQQLWDLNPDLLKGKLPKFLPDVPEIREDFADYLGEVQAFDAAVGLLLSELEERGELDNTIVVVSGDHGPPGFTHGKCDLYDFGTRVFLSMSGPGIKGGRVVDDFTSLMDLAPTFLDYGKATIPPVMTGRSLKPILESSQTGQVDPDRQSVVTGRERHVESARNGYLPYPMRALRTKDYLLIRNFEPDRWPMGAPTGLADGQTPSEEELTENTHVTLSDMDSGPTKAWLVMHRNEPAVKPFYDLAFAKRPARELYLLATDPDQMKNVAQDPQYQTVVQKLEQDLLKKLTAAEDPRLVNNGRYFEEPPLSGPLPTPRRKPAPRRQPAN